jgi:hypothetical protein
LLPANRLANFNVGVTNTSPGQQASVLGTYQVCATSDGALGAGETKEFTCEAVGRYVVVQLLGKEYLTLCEVEILGGKCSQPPGPGTRVRGRKGEGIWWNEQDHTAIWYAVEKKLEANVKNQDRSRQKHTFIVLL